MASYPLPQQALQRSECTYNGSPSSNHQSWKVNCGSNYFANGSAPSYLYEDTSQLAYPSDEASSSCSGITSYHSYLLSTLMGDSKSKIRSHPVYSMESQPTCFQNRSMSLDLSSVRTPSEFVPSQSSSTWWNQRAHPTMRNFPSYQSPTSTGMQPGAQSCPRWTDNKTAFAARPPVRCWNNCACTNYQHIHGSFSHAVNQQSSNVGYHNLDPFQNINTRGYKDCHMFEAGQPGEGIQVLRRDSISSPQASTGNHLMNLILKGTLNDMHGAVANRDTLCTLVPSGGCPVSASTSPTDAQSFSSGISQNHRINCDCTYRNQSISNVYSQKHFRSSRKRKSSEVLKFLAELTNRELKALIFAFEQTERRRQKAARLNLMANEMNALRQNPAAVQSNQFTAADALSPGAIPIPERSANLPNGHVEILDSCPPPALQKDKGHNSQVSCGNHVPLNANPTNDSNLENLSNAPSMSNRCAQHRDIKGNSVSPRQGVQQALPPHAVNHQHCHSLTGQASPSLQAHGEKNPICHPSAGTYYSHTPGAEGNVPDYSFNCSNSSSMSQKTFASVPVNLNYLGSSQQNGRYNPSARSLSGMNAPDANEPHTPGPKTHPSQYDEQSLKEIKALYDMLRTSYTNEMNGHPKRPKLEGCSTSGQPVSLEFGQMTITSTSPVQFSQDNHASQRIDCRDTWCPSAGLLSNSQTTTIAPQVAGSVHNENSPLVEPHVSSSSSPSHSRAQEGQNSEVSLYSVEIYNGVKDEVSLAPPEGTTEGSLIHPHPAGSMNQVCPSGARSNSPRPAETLKPLSCSSAGLGNLQLAPPQRMSADQIAEGYLASKCSATPGAIQENLTPVLRSEESSRTQKAVVDAGAHLSKAESHGQKPVPISEQHIAFSVASSKLSGSLSNQANLSGHNQGPADLHNETSSGVSAGIQIESSARPADIYTTNNSEINNVSTQKVAEERNSIPNSENPLAKESDTLEFILRSLGIIPEENEGKSAVIPTSLPSGVTSSEQCTAVSLLVDPPCTDVKQRQDLTLRSFNAVISSEKQQVIASVDPHSIGSMVTRDYSDVASFSPGERQQNGEVSAAVIPLQDERTTSALSKQKPDGKSCSISVCQPNCQAESGQNPHNSPSQETKLPIARTAQHNGAPNAVQLEDGRLNRVASCIENDASISLVSPSKLSWLFSSVSHTASTLLVEPLLTVQVEELRETLPPPSADNGNSLKSLLSSPSTSSCVQMAQSTRLRNAVANPCSVGMSGSGNGYPLKNDSGTSSPTDEPSVTVCSGTNVSNLSLFKYKQHVADGLHDSDRALRKQLDTVPEESTVTSTLETTKKPMDSTQVANASSLAGVGDSLALGAPSRVNTSNSLHVMQDILFSRIRRLKCVRSTLGISSLSRGSSGEVNADSLTVGQTSLTDGSLLQKKTLNGCTAVVASKLGAKDLLSGIQITFVFSLSEYWEHLKVINSTNLISKVLVTTGQEFLRSSEKVRGFSTTERRPNELNGPVGAAKGAVLNSEESTQRDLIADLPHSQNIVPFTRDSPAQSADPNISSIVAYHHESVFCPAVDLNRNLANTNPASETNPLVSTNVSKLLPGNGHCNQSLTEANTMSVQREALNSKEMMILNFFSKNRLRSATELEMTTESILRFWSPSGEVTESHHSHQETENGVAFDHGMEWRHSGLDLHTVASAAELNSSRHKLNAMHCLHFGFTATVDSRQLHGAKSHPNELCDWSSGTEVSVFEEHKPEKMESASRLCLMADEGRMDHWADTALSNVSLDTYKPSNCLQNNGSQATQVNGGKWFETGKAEITVPALITNSEEINGNDGCELLNPDQQNSEALTQPFNDRESWNECESNMDVSSEIKIKVLKHQELQNVLSELSNIVPTALILSPESKVTDETSEMESTGAHWKTSRNRDDLCLEVAHEQMETSVTECCLGPATSAPLSLGTVGSGLQH
ncbi:uncharacterized protein LOC144498703 [Mustelus asterias]